MSVSTAAAGAMFSMNARGAQNHNAKTIIVMLVLSLIVLAIILRNER